MKGKIEVFSAVLMSRFVIIKIFLIPS